MNYLEFFDNKIKKYQNSAGPLQKDPEAFARVQKLYEQDKPLSGTDPIGEMVVEGAVLSGPFDLAVQEIGKGVRMLKPFIQSKWAKYFSKTPAFKYHQTRLTNGGLQKVVDAGDIISITKPTIYDVSQPQDYLTAMKRIGTQMDDKQLLKYHNEFLQGLTQSDGGAAALSTGNTPTGLIIYNSKATIVKANPSEVLSHELDHAVHTPIKKAQGFDLEKYPAKTNYFSQQNNSELSARGSQIKDYYGFTSPTQKLTPEHLKYAQKNYIKDTGFDNDMSEFFGSIADYKKASKWLDDTSTAFALPILLNKNETTK